MERSLAISWQRELKGQCAGNEIQAVECEHHGKLRHSSQKKDAHGRHEQFGNLSKKEHKPNCTGPGRGGELLAGINQEEVEGSRLGNKCRTVEWPGGEPQAMPLGEDGRKAQARSQEKGNSDEPATAEHGGYGSTEYHATNLKHVALSYNHHLMPVWRALKQSQTLLRVHLQEGESNKSQRIRLCAHVGQRNPGLHALRRAVGEENRETKQSGNCSIGPRQSLHAGFRVAQVFRRRGKRHGLWTPRKAHHLLIIDLQQGVEAFLPLADQVQEARGLRHHIKSA
mmetsp:Transcript_20153/g.47667  ORF Transcript_20153/g.47667 Transcript_20153/m.47667 type:complete len:283 (-) Transcript_20153:666-1514(-)|eukprot:CAMPEP_0181540752 /NCGR_PEP_ID=MMETSP1110-20121109/77053_1 /TAXON_ID=174948 /ORGANISM="Symbiodinium sp., Strain CCMP421" /LENGTH=282 /DNA_ID=CAMNT_0023672413 /DNA_START=67 /DNA_END=915 /DNA_ORIENTATION=-